MMDENEQDDALSRLDAIDAEHGVNKPISEATEVVEK